MRAVEVRERPDSGPRRPPKTTGQKIFAREGLHRRLHRHRHRLPPAHAPHRTHRTRPDPRGHTVYPDDHAGDDILSEALGPPCADTIYEPALRLGCAGITFSARSRAPVCSLVASLRSIESYFTVPMRPHPEVFDTPIKLQYSVHAVLVTPLRMILPLRSWPARRGHA